MKWPASGDYLAIDDHADWDFGTGDFTWEMWIYSPFSSGANMKLWSSNQWGTQNSDWVFDVNPSRTIRFQWYNGSAAPEYSTSTAVAINTWTHVAGVRESGHARIYLDGVQRLTVATALNGALANVGTPFLGHKPANPSNGWVGYMDEIRLSTSCRYPSGTTFDPPEEKFADDTDTVLLIHSDTTDGDTTFSDASGQ